MKLKEIPNLSEATNLETVSLTYCTSLVELPSSIKNLHKLENLNMEGCKKLRVIPANINLASLEEVNMTYCSRLKAFPHFSSNISRLYVGNTKIEDVPSSIPESWLRLEKFYIGSKSLKRLTHVPECVSYLDLSNSDIKKIPDCVIGLPGLHFLIIKNCTKLVSLQGLPPSLLNLDASDCGSLKRVCFSLYEPKAYKTLNACKRVRSEKDAIRVSSIFDEPTRVITLMNCLSLEEEARRVIIQGWYNWAVLPGKEVPSEFTHRATGNSVTISERIFSASSRFKACLLFSPTKKAVRLGLNTKIVCRLRSKGFLISELNYSSIGTSDSYYFYQPQTEHLLVFSGVLFEEHKCFESEIQFEFSCKGNDTNIIECGIQMTAEEGSTFHDPNREVMFLNCLKLDEEARRSIIQRWAYKYVCLPRKEVPSEFTHRATGNTVTITKGTLFASTSFRACILLSPNLQHLAVFGYTIVCRLRSKGVLINELELSPHSRPWFWTGRCPHPLLTEHVFVFPGAMFKERRWVEVDSDIQFEFSCGEEHSKIIECGVQMLADEGDRSSRKWKKGECCSQNQ